MALTDYKITDAQISTKGVVAAPDKLVGTANENKQVFDRLIREAVKGDINGLIDALETLGVEHTVLLPTSAGMKYIRLNSDKVLETSVDGTNWEATGSSGHIILDKDGNTMTQRSRLKFANSTVQDVNGVTVVNGIKGDTGDTGPQGPAGPNSVSSSTASSLTGLLYGNGSTVGAKALDTSGLTEDNDHVPTSGVVKSALDAMNTLYTDSVTITNSSFTGSGIALYKKGNFVSFQVLIQKSDPGATIYSVGSAPVGFRPFINQQLDINQEDSNGVKSLCVIRFDAYGAVYLISGANSGTTYYRGTGCYIV